MAAASWNVELQTASETCSRRASWQELHRCCASPTCLIILLLNTSTGTSTPVEIPGQDGLRADPARLPSHSVAPDSESARPTCGPDVGEQPGQNGHRSTSPRPPRHAWLEGARGPG